MAITSQALEGLRQLDPSTYQNFLALNQGRPSQWWESPEADTELNRTIAGSPASFGQSLHSQWAPYFNVLGARGITNVRGMGQPGLEGTMSPQGGPLQGPIGGLQAAAPTATQATEPGAFPGANASAVQGLTPTPVRPQRPTLPQPPLGSIRGY